MMYVSFGPLLSSAFCTVYTTSLLPLIHISQPLITNLPSAREGQADFRVDYNDEDVHAGTCDGIQTPVNFSRAPTALDAEHSNEVHMG
jgi:hypothetical protein